MLQDISGVALGRWTRVWLLDLRLDSVARPVPGRRTRVRPLDWRLVAGFATGRWTRGWSSFGHGPRQDKVKMFFGGSWYDHGEVIDSIPIHFADCAAY